MLPIFRVLEDGRVNGRLVTVVVGGVLVVLTVLGVLTVRARTDAAWDCKNSGSPISQECKALARE